MAHSCLSASALSHGHITHGVHTFLWLPFPRRGATLAEGLKQAAKYGAAAVGAGLGAYLTTLLKAKRQSAAIIELANLLVAMPNPAALTREQVRGCCRWQIACA